MELKDLDGVYELTIKTNAGGVYSQKPITGNICIENGNIRGTDELNIMWCGSISDSEDNEHVKYSIIVDPQKAEDAVIRKDNGLMTDQHRNFIGTFKIAQKGDDDLMLSSFENMSHDALSMIV